MEAMYLSRPQKLTTKATLTENISTGFLVQGIVDASIYPWPLGFLEVYMMLGCYV